VAELEAEFGEETDEVLFGQDYLQRQARNNVLDRDAATYHLLDRGELARQYREMTEETPPQPLDFDMAAVISIPSSLRSDWDDDDTSADFPVFSLKQALQRTITEAENDLYLAVPFFELDGFNILEDEFLEAADNGVHLYVLTREVFNPRNEDSIFHSKKLEALRELTERYQSVAPREDLIEIRDFYHQIGPGNAALDMSIHSKMAVADHSLAYIGSGEVRDSSMNLNGEAGYLVPREDDVAFWDQFFHFFWDKADPVFRDYLNEQTE
jgi:phosphatidylserine/phosphatidylglycerophosphate/cardiolipin synthase-like enzyme